MDGVCGSGVVVIVLVRVGRGSVNFHVKREHEGLGVDRGSLTRRVKVSSGCLSGVRATEQRMALRALSSLYGTLNIAPSCFLLNGFGGSASAGVASGLGLYSRNSGRIVGRLIGVYTMGGDNSVGWGVYGTSGGTMGCGWEFTTFFIWVKGGGPRGRS